MGKTLVIGGGVTGLSAALALQEAGREVALVELAGGAGGACRTVREAGFLCEMGPNTLMIASHKLKRFLEGRGLLEGALDAAPHARRRYVAWQGKVVPLPMSPGAFLRSPLLSASEKVRLLCEPFQSRTKNPEASIAEFFEHRLGVGAVREFLDPFVSGIYAGDPRRLVARHVMPTVWEAEQRAGSIVRGMLTRQSAEPSVKRRMVSWPEGLGALPQRMASCLGAAYHAGAEARSIERRSGEWVVGLGDGATLSAEKIILAASADRAGALLGRLHPSAAILENIPHAPLSVVQLGFRREQVGHPLDGFGMLISRSRGIRTLGVLFSSTLFPGRAPEGAVLLTCFVGGRLDPEAVTLGDDRLQEIVCRDLGSLLCFEGRPIFRHVVRWARAIPQYEAGHGAVLAACDAMEGELPGLFLAGNYRKGVSMGDCMLTGLGTAELALS
jgi:oxygen-dependent protoporphyrinogen oxidase